MSTGLSHTAAGRLSPRDRIDVAQAFTLLKSCATFAGVPYAAHWQLDYQPDRAAHWRVTDTTACGDSHVAFTLASVTPWGLCAELEAYAKALRGMKEILKSGYSQDLIAPSRRPDL
jgi:hypothetical protein